MELGSHGSPRSAARSNRHSIGPHTRPWDWSGTSPLDAMTAPIPASSRLSLCFVANVRPPRHRGRTLAQRAVSSEPTLSTLFWPGGNNRTTPSTQVAPAPLWRSVTVRTGASSPLMASTRGCVARSKSDEPSSDTRAHLPIPSGTGLAPGTSRSCQRPSSADQGT